MPFAIEKLPDLPCVMMHFSPPFDHKAPTQAMAIASEYYSTEGDHCYFVFDVAAFDMSFEQIVDSMAHMTLNPRGLSLDAPNQTPLFVVSDVMQSEMDGRPTYGSVTLHLFTSQDDALEWVRGQHDDA